MKKLSNILDESVWGGMLNRSTGDSVRKEDDVNLLDKDGLYDYLTSHYKNLNSFAKIVNSTSFNAIGVPVLIQGGVDFVSLCYPDKEVFIQYAAPYKVKGLFSKLADRYALRSDSDTKPTKYIISPKNGSEVTNTFFIDVIDFLIDNIPDSFEKGVKKIVNESVWGGMLNRSTGDAIRKEDEVNLLDGEGFCEYLESKYDIDNSHSKLKSEFFCVKTPSVCFINIPLFIYNDKKDFENHASFTYYPDEISIGFGCTDKKYCKLFLNLLGERFAGPRSEISLDMKTQYFKGNITNKTLIEMIDFVIDNIKSPLIPLIVKK